MFMLSAIGNVLMTILAWIIMLLLNGIAWAFILLILTACVGIFIESVFPELATLCVEGTFRLIPLFW